MSIKKAVIPAAGLGTRLLPVTKEIPKEMLPVFDQGGASLKPLIQIIFERLHGIGVREFCIITGRGKRALEDHFSRDEGYLVLLEANGKEGLAERLRSFYDMVESSKLFWINQPRPTGLGAAVALAEPFGGGEPFIVHAGDTYVASTSYLDRMTSVFEEVKPEALFLTARVEDPRSYGVVEEYRVEAGNLCRVLRVVEKPKVPKTNIAIVPVYVFTKKLFEVMRGVKPGIGGEVQLTDAVQALAGSGKVYALGLEDDEDYIDIGKPESYLRALEKSYGRG